jgi:hypothetical protein
METGFANDRVEDEMVREQAIPQYRLAAIQRSCARLAAALVLGTIGLVAGIALGGEQDRLMLAGLGLAGGAIFGAIILWQIALLDKVWNGAVVGGLLPIGMILLSALRRGRLDGFFEAFGHAQFYLVMGSVFAGGALLGSILVLTRKWLYGLRVPKNREDGFEYHTSQM